MGDASGRPEVSRDALIGKLALELHWVTPLQLREALSEQWADVESGKGQTRSLGSILVARGILTEAQLVQLQEQVSAQVPAFPPFGKYNILREIGRGAVGVVYEAEDTELKRRVALKMLIENPARSAEELKPEHDRFIRESQLHRSLPPHPGVVAVLEADIIENRRYLAMELVDGVSMGTWHKHGSVTVRQRVSLLREVALAVHHAHRHGIVHRDLKPENILVDRNHRPRITDFGLAKLVGGTAPPLATATGTALGTPAYMSPEQVKGGRDVDARSDIYTLGVMLYEILTGRRPFEADSPYELMMKTVHEEVVPPSKLTTLKINPVVYRNLENICLIALAKEPGDRYADAESFARDLTKWLQGDDMRIVVPRTWRMWRSRKMLRILLGCLAATGLVAGGVFFYRSREGGGEAGGSLLKAPVIRVNALLPGAIVESYAGVNFNVLGLRRIDNRKAFDDPENPLWKEGPTLWTSQRWIGYLRIFASGTYTFELMSKEQVRLVIDDVQVAASSGAAIVPVVLREGTHKFLLEHGHRAPDDVLQVRWRKEGEAEAYPLGPISLTHLKTDLVPVAPATPRFRMPNVPGAEEGELLTVADDSGHGASPHSYGMYAAFWKGVWSGDSHLWWGPGVQKGDRLRVRFAAGETGRGTLALGLTRACDHGIFRISVNGKPIADALDLWSDELLTGEHEFKGVELRAGVNELEFTVVGSNPSAREWGPGSGVHKVGIDYVLVR